MNPSSNWIFAHQLTKWHFLSPWVWRRFLINFLHISRKHAAFEIAGTNSQKNIVRMPIETSDSRSDRFFNLLWDPPETLVSLDTKQKKSPKTFFIPMIFLFVVTNGDQLSPASDSKFVLRWRPFYVSGSTIKTNQNQFRFPNIFIECPNECIFILRARDNSICFGSPVEASNRKIVLRENMDRLPIAVAPFEDMNFVRRRRNSYFWNMLTAK